jgi:hypothetical protein
MATIQRAVLLSLILAVYASGFALPLYEQGEVSPDVGWIMPHEAIFFWGWEGFCVVPLASHGRFSFWPEGSLYLLAWLANPCLWVGCVQFARGRYAASALWGCMATLLALAGMLCLVVLGFKFLLDSKGALLSAYWLWLTSMALLAVTADACRSEARKR